MNVEELLSSKKIAFTISGKDYLVKCLNPEHDDSNPSMRVDKVLGIFQCMSCGFRGNIFFLYNHTPNKLELMREKVKRKIHKIRQQSIGYSLPKDAMAYIGNWRNISPETYRKFGAFKSAEKEFINRVVFPVTDITGRTVAFIGRDDTGTLGKKYYIHPGGASLPIFPSVTPIQGRVILVEGIFDMINLHDKGLTNAVTSFGVTTVKESSFDLLKVQGVTGIDILYDNDTAGADGAKKVKEIAEKIGIEATIRTLKGNKDPGELTKEQVSKLKEILYG
jgi:DNA primase